MLIIKLVRNDNLIINNLQSKISAQYKNMSSLNTFRKSDTILNLCIYTLLCYFIYHVLNGDRGLFSYLKLNAELHEKQEIMQQLKSERITLEKKVALMSSNSIDHDTLDEIARNSLGLMAPDEEVWVIKSPQDKNNE